MNAFTLLKATEHIGAKELRLNLDKILRRSDHPYRVMVHNKPAAVVLPDRQFMDLLELLEELKDAGLLDEDVRRFQMESRKKHPWFWSVAWQQAERGVDQEIKKGKVKTFKSAKEAIAHLHK